MHYTGTIWRPPHEMYSAWIEVSQGCTYNQCKFCNLYNDIPFCISKIDNIIEDFYEISLWYPQAKRVFLIGANPFVLSFNRLKGIANIAKQYLSQLQSIGCFARVTDISLKTDKELKELRDLGYDELTIGVESGNDEALDFMKKGYTSKDIIKQCQRLDQAGIHYHFFYIIGLAGKGNAVKSAIDTAKVFNQLNPKSIIAGILTIFEDTEIFQDINWGNFEPVAEKEALFEMKTFIENCQINVQFFANNISNAVVIEGKIPKDTQKMINKIQNAMKMSKESDLIAYRKKVKHF